MKGDAIDKKRASFKGPRPRWGSCWTEEKRTIFSPMRGLMLSKSDILQTSQHKNELVTIPGVAAAVVATGDPGV